MSRATGGAEICDRPVAGRHAPPAGDPKGPKGAFQTPFL